MKYRPSILLRLIVLPACVIFFAPRSARLQNSPLNAPRPEAAEGVPLNTVLEKLRQRKRAAFLYESSVIEGVVIETPFDYREKLPSLLAKILPPAGLSFERAGRSNFIIKRREGLPEYGPVDRRRRTRDPNEGQWISGQVLGEDDGLPLIGGTVQAKGKAMGTTTDTQGHFRLQLPAGRQTLVISYLGYESQEIDVDGPGPYAARLRLRANRLHDVVVTAVGIEANKRTLGYALDNLDAETITYAHEPNLVNALSARSAGVWVNSASGSPGASASVVIRGFSSINGNNKPLFVLDGVPIDNKTTGNGTTGVDVSNRLIDLNPHDIAEISILKGPAATALYGIRAANGAVIITTRRGESRRPEIRYFSSAGLSVVNRLPQRQQVYAQGKYKGGQAVYRGPESTVNTSYGPPLHTLEYDGATDYPYDSNGRLVPAGQGNGQSANLYDPYETFFVIAPVLDNHLSVTGGTRWIDYYVSAGYLHQSGVVPNAFFERYSLRSNLGFHLSEKLSVRLATNLVHSGGSRMKRGSMFSGVPVGLFRNPISFDIGNGKRGRAAARDVSSYLLPNGEQRAYRGSGRYDNPFWSVNRNPYEDQVNRILQNSSLNYQLAPGWTLTYRAGLDHYTDDRLDAYDTRSGTHPLGQVEVLAIQSTQFNSDLLLRAEQQWGDNWRLNATLGHNFFSSRFSLRETEGEELLKPGIFNISNTAVTVEEEILLRKRLFGLYADLLLTYHDLVFLQFTGRNDWSSTLPRQNNSFFYPSVNLALEFTRLLNSAEWEWLSYGKIRASLSQVGNDAEAYLTDTYFRPAIADGDDLLPGTTFPAYGVTAFERSGVLGNPELRAETTTAMEAGLDLQLLDGRLGFDLTWYRTAARDQIIDAQLSAPSGFLSSPRNVGTIENEGIEIGLMATPVRTRQFRWNLSANFTRFRSRILETEGEMPDIILSSFSALSSMIIAGKPYGVLVGTAYKRDEAGRMVIGADGFPIVASEQKVLGDPTPDWLAGLTNTLAWRNVSLQFLVDVRRGGDLWNGTRGVMSYLGVSKESGDRREVRNYIFEGVTETGEPNQTPVDLADPANGMSGIFWRRYGFLGLAEKHIEDGSWVRLRELTLKYRLQPGWRRRPDAEMTVALSGKNLFLWTSYSGIDPETNLRGDSNIMGWDYFNLPNIRTYRLSVEITF